MNKKIGDMTNSELIDFIIELQEKNSRYERTLIEIREFLNKKDKLYLLSEGLDDILQIIDKVGENKDDNN